MLLNTTKHDDDYSKQSFVSECSTSLPQVNKLSFSYRAYAFFGYYKITHKFSIAHKYRTCM